MDLSFAGVNTQLCALFNPGDFTGFMQNCTGVCGGSGQSQGKGQRVQMPGTHIQRAAQIFRRRAERLHGRVI